MTTENGKELGGHHCPDWDGLWVTPSSPEHEACTCYIGSAMTTNKPEVVGWMIPDGSIYKRSVVAELARRTGERPEPLIRLSDYEALQAECAKLRKDAERIEWLEDQTKKSRTGISFDYHRYVEDGYVVDHGYRFMRRHFVSGFKDSLRKAIDASMQGDQP